MIRTVVWFGVGGFFTACYANLVRGLPMWRTPLMHVFWTSVGLGLGYRGHIFEETSEERYKELIKKHKNAPWYPKGQLLAERYAREKAEREAAMAGMEQAAAYNTILTRELGVPVFEWVEEILHCGPIRMNSLWQYFDME